MASIHLTTWRGIPVLVTAVDAAGEATVPLGPGFQDLIDRVAVRDGVTDADAYLAEWGTEAVPARPGAAAEVVEAVARELEGRIEAFRQHHLGGSADPGQAPGGAAEGKAG